MTVTEACDELGVDADANADMIRRSYMRRLKTRKPETDPEGFRRLREAYELLRGDMRVMFVSASSFAEMPEERAPEIQTPEQVVTALATETPSGDLGAAADAAEARLNRVLEEPSAPVVLDRVGVTTLVLLLLANRETERARVLFAMLEGALQVGAREPIGPSEAVPWLFAREILALPAAFPEVVRAAFAQSVIEGEPVIASEVITAIRVREGEPEIAALRALVAAHAPMLFPTYVRELAPLPKRSWWSTVAPTVRRWTVYALVAALSLTALVTFVASSTPITVPEPPRAATFEEATTRARHVATLGFRVSAQEVAMLAGDVAQSLGSKSCFEAAERHRRLHGAVERSAEPAARALRAPVLRLRTAIIEACSGLVLDLP